MPLPHSLNVIQEQMNLILPHQIICGGFKYISSKFKKKFISGHKSKIVSRGQKLVLWKKSNGSSLFLARGLQVQSSLLAYLLLVTSILVSVFSWQYKLWRLSPKNSQICLPWNNFAFHLTEYSYHRFQSYQAYSSDKYA